MANAHHIALVIQSILGGASQKQIGFNMGTYVCHAKEAMTDQSERNCGTVACIAGHAYILASQANSTDAMNAEPDDIEQIAAEFLGLSDEDAAHLFYDLPDIADLSQVTAAVAINTLEHLAQTGKVEWRFP